MISHRSQSRPDRYRLINGQLIDDVELAHHVSNTISGQYSLGGNADCALIEYCVQFDACFEAITYQGVPDIRIIVFRGFPVMAMVRLPTRQSGGKANLHQGAVGVGVDLATGVTLGGVLGHEAVGEHPDTGAPIAGVAIPGWDKILVLAARCHELAGLGYLGVDIVLDADLGPLILELNARPGLDIQIANRRGLKQRLDAVEAQGETAVTVDARVAFAKHHFARVASW